MSSVEYVTTAVDEPTTAPTRIGLEPLTCLELTPPAFARAAADAGFTDVSLRLIDPSTGHLAHPMRAGEPMFDETARIIDGEGLRVLGFDVVPVADDVTDWPTIGDALETIKALGGSFANVAVNDADTTRRRDTVMRIASMADERGIRAIVEPMAYSSVRNLNEALEVVAGTSAGIQIDVLHLARFHQDASDVESLDASLLDYLQICGVPEVAPATANGLSQEARSSRGFPDHDDAHVAPLLAMFAGKPASVEAPNTDEMRRLGTPDYLRALYSSAVRALSRVSAPGGR